MERNLILLAVLIFSLAGIVSCTDNDPTDMENEISESCFDVTPNTAKVGDEVQFANCSQNSTHFVWAFGDGESSTEQDPIHIYQRQGDYEIKLLAGVDKNADGVLNIDDDPDSTFTNIEIDPNHLSVELTILSASSWTPQNPDLSIVPGATISLYKDSPNGLDIGEPDYTLISDENGKVKIYDMDIVAECFTVEKEGASNLVNDYLIVGVFQNQEEIDSSPIQEGATIGGLKYADINADFLINEDDRIPCQGISISPDETFTKEVIIGN